MQPGVQFFREMFDLGDVCYQYFRHRDATFILLDSNVLTRDKAQAQVDWLAATLKSIPPGEGPIVVVLHHPLYTSGHRKPGRTGLRRLLQPLFEEYGVDVVIAGHEHHYERTHPISGTTYFVAGSSGTPVREIEAGYSGLDFTAHISSPLNFMVFTVSGTSLSAQAINAAGEVFDVMPAFDWRANDPAGPTIR